MIIILIRFTCTIFPDKLKGRSYLGWGKVVEPGGHVVGTKDYGSWRVVRAIAKHILCIHVGH